VVSRCRLSDGTERIVFVELLLEIADGVLFPFKVFIAVEEIGERVRGGAWIV